MTSSWYLSRVCVGVGVSVVEWWWMLSILVLFFAFCICIWFSFKPQKINAKFQGTVRQLLHKKIREAYVHPQFVSDVMKPLVIESIIDNDVQNLSGGELQRVAITACLGQPGNIYLVSLLGILLLLLLLLFILLFILLLPSMQRNDCNCYCWMYLWLGMFLMSVKLWIIIILWLMYSSMWTNDIRLMNLRPTWIVNNVLLQRNALSVSSWTQRRLDSLWSTISSWLLIWLIVLLCIVELLVWRPLLMLLR